MTILDAYAVLAFLTNEPAAPAVESLILTATASLTALGVAEVLDHLVRIVGATDEDAALDLAQLGLADPTDIDPAAGQAAGLLRARHYHRTTRAVSLADCVAAAVARQQDRALATSDPHVLDVCHDEGILVHVLPDTTGHVWTPPDR